MAEDTITLKSGVVLRTKRVGYWIIAEAFRHLKAPTVPVQFIEEKGREEENPLHPDYLKAMEEFNANRGTVAVNAYVYFGTEVVRVPDGIPGPSDDWMEEFAWLGITAAESKPERYVQWLRLVACRGEQEELEAVVSKVTGQNAVTEEAVTAAAESFRGDEIRGTDLEVPAAPASDNGHRNRTGGGRPRARVRGA